MNKQEQILAKKLKPIEIGDFVKVEIPYTTYETVTTGKGKNKLVTQVPKPSVFSGGCYVRDIINSEEGLIYLVDTQSIRIPNELSLKRTYDKHVSLCEVKAEFVSPTYLECGENPFKKEKFRVSFYNQDISCLLGKACYAKRDENYMVPKYNVHNGLPEADLMGKTYDGVNFNPYVTDANGEKQYYQRDLVWTLEQKRLLIDSIYNGIEIGKFLFRYKSWEDMVEGMREQGHGYSWDCVDGKQRFFAILEFVQGKYNDSHGNNWEDLSANAQRHFLDYSNLSYGEMGENAKDSDVVETFLTLNFTGTPMSKEHIEFVQSFKMQK